MIRRTIILAAACAALPARANPVDAARRGDWAEVVRQVRAHVRYRPRPDPKRMLEPAQCWAQGVGDCTEQAFLIRAFLRMAGVADDRMALLRCLVNGTGDHLVLVVDGLALDPTQMAGVLTLERRHDLTRHVVLRIA